MNPGKILIALSIIWLFGNAHAQLSVRTLSTARSGRLPGTDEEKYPSIYTDLILEYRYKALLSGFRTEGFTADSIGNPYSRISQLYLQYSWAWGSARMGNAYDIFGRGLIFRGFELPGFVNESRVFRTQHRVIRDVKGLNLKLNRGPFDLKFIIGKTPINALDPPEDRIDGDLTGGQIKVELPADFSIGAAHLQYETTRKDRLSAYFLSWSGDEFLTKIGAKDLTFDFYGEVATNKTVGKYAEFNNDTPHALYVSGNLTWNTFGGSLEYKDYFNFDFGINDPPPLIRENNEYLLNRITHRLDSFGERGFQLEFYYSPGQLTRFTTNLSRAKNNFDNTFLQRYLGFDYTSHPWSARIFVDHGKEEFLSQTRRITTGFAPDFTFNDGKSLGVDLEWQHIKSDFGYTFTNFYTNLSLKNWRNLSLAVSLERSTDPDVTGVNPLTETADKFFLNGSIGWTPKPQISVQLLAGERRRSTKCDHGFCLEVLDFKGVELRVDTIW